MIGSRGRANPLLVVVVVVLAIALVALFFLRRDRGETVEIEFDVSAAPAWVLPGDASA